MSHTRKVAFNTVAQFIGKAVGIAISLVTVAILFRFLGVTGVGEYTTVFAFTAFFTLFADIGLGWTMLREISINTDKAKIFKNIFTFRLLLGIIVFSACSLIVWLFNYPIEVKWAVAVLSVAMLFQSMTSMAVQVYLNFYRMDIAVSAEVVGKATILLIVYLLSRFGGNLSSVMFAYVMGAGINFLIVWLGANKFLRTGLAFDYTYWKYAFKQALPIGITLVFGFVYYKVDSIMLSLMKGMFDVGIYGASYKLLEVLQMFPALFLGSAFPLITRYVTSQDERLPSAFQKQFDFLAFIAVPIVAAAFVLARPIIAFVGGTNVENFTEASTLSIAGFSMTSVTCLKILIFSVGINFFSTLYSFMIVSLGKQKQMIWPTIGFAVFNVLLNLYAISRFTYIGSSVTTLLTEIVVVVSLWYIVNRNLRLPVNAVNLLKSVLCGLVMGLVLFFANWFGINLFVNLILGIIVYVALAFSLQIVSKDMIRSVFTNKLIPKDL